MKYSEISPMQCMMTHSTWYNGAVENSAPIGILWHDTAAGNPDLCRYVQPYETDPNYDEMIKILGKNRYQNDWNHAARNAGVNAFIGKLKDGTVTSVQVGEWTMAPWGCGNGNRGSCNGYVWDKNKQMLWVMRHWIQFEICDDGYKKKDYFNEIFEEGCQLTAFICKQFGLDPHGTVKFADTEVPVITCHIDSYYYELGSDHSDTLKWFKKFGKTMEDVRNRVQEILDGEKPFHQFHKGDLVKITGTKYYSGKTIPAWVRGQNWYVYSAPEGSDRVVINENEKHNNSIMSPIHDYDLELIKPAPEYQVIEVGDLVKITGTTYYSGKKIPQWVRNQNWYVKKAPINSDRIVIDENEAHTEHINSPVNRKDLEIVKKHK